MPSPPPPVGPRAPTIPVGRSYNHDLLREEESQKQFRAEFPLVADVFIDRDLLRAFGPLEDRARLTKRWVKRLGTLAILLMIVAFSGAIAGLYDMTRPAPLLPHYVRFGIELAAIAGLVLAYFVAPWAPRGSLRRLWLRDRFGAEILRMWHFRRALNGAFVDHVVGGQGAAAAKEIMPSVEGIVEILRTAGVSRQSKLIQSGEDAIAHDFEPTLSSDPRVSDQLMRAYDKLRVTHQDEFFHDRAHDLYPDFAWLSNSFWARVVGAAAAITLAGALCGSFLTLAMPKASAWTPLVVTACIVAGIAARSWGEGMRFEEEQDHYIGMHTKYRSLKSRWDAAITNADKLLIVKDLEAVAMNELRGFLRVHARAQFII